MYCSRYLQEKLVKLANYFKIILLTGARQVGKTTLLKHLFPQLPYFVFDPIQDLYNLKKDPDLFLNNFPPPILLDEIQYIPELLPALKRKVDQNQNRGQYFLTGSQQFSILKNVAESLAGRVGILHLENMSPFEMFNDSTQTPINTPWLLHYLKSPTDLPVRFKGVATFPYTLFELIWRGSIPGLIGMPNELVSTFHPSYLQTYIERDVRLIENIQNLSLFNQFHGLLSALTSQEINQSQLGRELGLSSSTVQRWLNALINSFQWRSISPFSLNTIKRITKKPKGYLTDTGLACYQMRISSPVTLAQHPQLGALYETFCVNLIYQMLTASSTFPQIYHWRSSNGAEVDLILEQDGKYFPIEIKCRSHLTQRDTRGLHAFTQTYPSLNIQPGLIIYAGEQCYWLNSSTIALPWNALF